MVQTKVVITIIQRFLKTKQSLYVSSLTFFYRLPQVDVRKTLNRPTAICATAMVTCLELAAPMVVSAALTHVCMEGSVWKDLMLHSAIASLDLKVILKNLI